ncbi:hypothetical protein HDU96_001684 [Phlyctochytrium bullatum]|nr:hypothetical protein HDU96_001684 [Phlyctochytrium bullatum]
MMRALWLCDLMHDFGIWQQDTITIYNHNKSANALVNGFKTPERIKRNLIKLKFIRDEIKAKDIVITYCRTDEMIAEVLTNSY